MLTKQQASITRKNLKSINSYAKRHNSNTLTVYNSSFYVGETLAGPGDLSGDGRADFLIGAPRADRAYLVFGIDAPSLDSRPFPFLNDLDGDDGYVILGRSGDGAGAALAGAGDVNGDGAADMLIGAPRASGVGGAETGVAYVVFGTPTQIFRDGFEAP